MHMKEPSGVKAYAFPVDGGYEVVYSDDWHGVPERISEDMFMPFIDFCRSGIDDIDDVVIVREELPEGYLLLAAWLNYLGRAEEVAV